MGYLVVDDKGFIIAVISKSFVLEIVNKVPGFFRDYDTKDGVRRAYEITEPRTFKVADVDIEMYLWKGYVLLPKNDD